MILFELWYSESECSYTLRYFPDIADYHVRPVDERIVWSTRAHSYEEALRGRNEFLGWGA